MTLKRALAALLVWGGAAHAQQPTIRLVDQGPGAGPAMLAQALTGPHTIIGPGERRVVLPADSTYRGSVIVLGREAALDGVVDGDLIVVGGDLHIHPHSTIRGRAMAFGGAVYESAMATIGKGTFTYRDFTYDIARDEGGYELRYRSFVDRPETAITLPGIYGVRLPAYDRTNGLSLSVSPLIAVPGTRLTAEPRVTYRSQLGAIDGGLDTKLMATSRTTLRVKVERATPTNEAWIWPDLVNSAATLVFGDDSRNYYRATRVDALGSFDWHWTASTLSTYVGGRWERAESARPDSSAEGGPWSIEGRHDRLDMLRPNPPIDSGTIVSGLVGLHLDGTFSDITARLAIDLEGGGFSPKVGSDETSTSFAQATVDGSVSFPTFGTQSLRFEGHAVVSAAGDLVHDRVVTPSNASARRAAPRQRWAYVGGWGSIPTIDMLSRGGDELIYVDGRYNIPIDAVQLPLVGAPVFTLRTVLGGADIQRWPSLAQAAGVRLSISAAYVEYLVDPANRRQFVGWGLSIAR